MSTGPGPPGESPDQPHDRAHDEQVGSVADEAERLLSALGDWAHDLGGHRPAGGPADDGLAPGCTWCPLCRTLHVVRSASPEVRTQLGVAATALLRAGAGLLAGLEDGRARGGVREPDEAPDGAPQGAGPRGSGPVERIELDEDDDGWEA